jgi:hypothetical protein
MRTRTERVNGPSEVIGEGALGSATSEKAVCLAEDAVVLELGGEEAGAVWVVSEWQVAEFGESRHVEKT